MAETEDKGWWVVAGRTREQAFVDRVCPMLGLDGHINAAKSASPYVPDLIVDGALADLKCQRHPFFTAGRYGRDPQWTVTFNKKDFDHYQGRYPGLTVYFWVDWKPPWTRYGVTVMPMVGVWKMPFSAIRHRVLNPAWKVPLHAYEQRTDDHQGNARDSYLLDLRWFPCLPGSTLAKDIDWREEDGASEAGGQLHA